MIENNYRRWDVELGYPLRFFWRYLPVSESERANEIVREASDNVRVIQAALDKVTQRGWLFGRLQAIKGHKREFDLLRYALESWTETEAHYRKRVDQLSARERAEELIESCKPRKAVRRMFVGPTDLYSSFPDDKAR